MSGPEPSTCFRGQPIPHRVGHVIPTLLNLNGSILAYDVKNELWDVTAGMRAKKAPACSLDHPTAQIGSIRSLRFARINEVHNTQNIVEMLVNPTGVKHTMVREPPTGEPISGGADPACALQTGSIPRIWRRYGHRCSTSSGRPWR